MTFETNVRKPICNKAEENGLVVRNSKMINIAKRVYIIIVTVVNGTDRYEEKNRRQCKRTHKTGAKETRFLSRKRITGAHAVIRPILSYGDGRKSNYKLENVSSRRLFEWPSH